jgi:hypothetical protein
LSYATSYTARVSGGTAGSSVTDASGNLLPSTVTWSFATGPRVVPPVISNVIVAPQPGGTANISWTTDEPATSSIVYGTTTGSMASGPGSSTTVTSHSLVLTNLVAGVTYLYQLTSVDVWTNVATWPGVGVNATFTMPSAALADITIADFSAGTTGTSTYISQTADGEVMLAPAMGQEFSGSALPSDWAMTSFASGGAATVSGGLLVVDGALTGPSPLYTQGRSLEFSATFSGDPYQHVGFGVLLAGVPWAIFSTGSGGALYARSNNGFSSTDTLLAGNWLNAPHRFRIDWGTTSLVYSIDGTQVAAHAFSIGTSMRPLVSDLNVGGGAISVDWMRLSPYPSAGSFISRVLDAGGTASWSSAHWTASLPAGTSLALWFRIGNTPVPDGTWTSFTSIGSGGAISGSSRYIQYRADLSATSSSLSPSLNDIAFTASSLVDVTPPAVAVTQPATGATVVGVQTVAAIASDSVGVVGVQLLLDGAPLGAEILTAPYSVTWNSGFVSNGVHTLSAKARDAANNVGTAPSVTVTVSNSADTTPPTISITNPLSGSTVAGIVHLSVAASDNVGVVSVQYVVDGVNFGSALTTAPYTLPWDTTALSLGTHTISASAVDPSGNVGTAPTVSVSVTGTFADVTAGDFLAGTLDAGAYVSQTGDGELILAPTVGTEFSGSTLPSGWSTTAWGSGGSAVVGGGVITLDGYRVSTDSVYAPGRSLEFVATFSGDGYEHIGLGLTFNETPWMIFSTGGGGGLLARTNNGSTSTDTPIPGSWLGAPHRFRIDWTSTGVVYSIDGTQVASHAIAVTTSVRPIASDLFSGGGTVTVDWMRVTPYAPTTTFVSRTFDAGHSLSWKSVVWNSTVPAGTSISISVRAGNTPVPDGSWTAFAPVASSGASISLSGRYVDYRIVMSTTDPSQTAVVSDLTITH